MSDTPMGRIVGKWPGDETEEQMTEALEQLGKCQKCRKLEDLIRWRSRWDEPPPMAHGIYLVTGFNFDMKRRIWVAKFDGEWPANLAVDHWRPIGPLPGEGGE